MILSESYLRSEIPLYINKFQTLKESTRYNNQIQYDLFISHSYMDKELINVLYNKFLEAGYTVYVDWKEETLQDRENVSSETAKILKERINNCKGLSYIATSNITNSKWCPWELGYADGKKNKAVILPITKEKVDEFRGLEYLGIYPYLEYCNLNNGKWDFFVNDRDDRKKYILREWLNGQKLKSI